MDNRSTARLSLIHLARRPERSGEGAPPLLILLHGYGSNEHDLFGLAPYLDPRFLVVSARAPYTLMPGGYAWFELGWTATGITIDFQQAEASRKRAVAFVGEAATAYGADPACIYLVGFSQGAMVAAGVALTEPDLVAGTVLMSGRVPDQLEPQFAAPERLAGKPFLVVHGRADEVLPIENGRASHAILQRLPVDLIYKEYPMGHEVSMQSLTDVTTWLTDRLDQAPPG